MAARKEGWVAVDHNNTGQYLIKKWSLQPDTERDTWHRETYLYDAPFKKQQEVNSYREGQGTTLLPNRQAAGKELKKLEKQFGITPNLREIGESQ